MLFIFIKMYLALEIRGGFFLYFLKLAQSKYVVV